MVTIRNYQILLREELKKNSFFYYNFNYKKLDNDFNEENKKLYNPHLQLVLHDNKYNYDWNQPISYAVLQNKVQEIREFFPKIVEGKFDYIKCV